MALVVVIEGLPMLGADVGGVLSMVPAFGATARIDYRRVYPATVNHDREAAFAAEVAEALVGRDNVARNLPPGLLPPADAAAPSCTSPRLRRRTEVTRPRTWLGMRSWRMVLLAAL